MNNQAQLIDKEQILKWLEDEFRNYPEEHMGNYGAGQDMLDMIATKIESGAFDYTPPVPTIKPGDKVKYTGWQFKDEVDTAIVDHLRVQALATYAVIESGKKYYIVPLNHLEVVE